jgi:hypothetical protein
MLGTGDGHSASVSIGQNILGDEEYLTINQCDHVRKMPYYA